jgi:hypothetical protein
MSACGHVADEGHGAKHVGFAPPVQTSTCSAIERVVYLNPEIADGALDFSMPEQQLHGTKVASPPVDQRRLRPAERVSREKVRVEPTLSIQLVTRRAY